MDIRPIDMASNAELEEAFRLESMTTQLLLGDTWTPLPADVRIGRWVHQPGFTYALIGAWRGSTLVGLAQRCCWEKEPHDFFINVAVEPSHRGQGIGTALLHAIEAGAGSDARRFVSEQSLRDRKQVTTLERGFAAAVGYRLGTVEITLRTDLSKAPVPVPQLPEGWHVSTHVDGIPPHLLEEVGAVQGLVDQEAPSGEVEWHAHAVTPEEYRADLHEILNEGSHLIEAVVLAPGGHVAGWTGLKTAVSAHHPARVLGTMVLGESRGHGLGMALKSAVAARAAELGVTRLATETNEANRWMLDINERQGFKPTGCNAVFQREARRAASPR